MTRYIQIPIFIAVLCMAAVPAYSGNDTPTPQHKKLFSGSPLAGAFYENRGQILDTDGNARPEIKYYAYCNGVQLYFTPRGWHTVYSVAETGDDAVSEATGDGGIEKANSAARFMDKQIPDQQYRLYRMDLILVGCNENAVVEPLGLQERYLNYYLAHCPDGITHVPGYASLRYRNIYDNIDLILHASTQGMKYEFEVRPGGRVEDIRLRHEGTDGIDEQEDGSLHVRWPEGYTKEGRPFSYQLAGVELREVRRGSH
jgi:hypothetical protein